jgi:hypothetical protein
MGRKRELKDMGKELRKAVLVLEEARSVAHPNHHTICLFISDALQSVKLAVKICQEEKDALDD